MFISSMFKKSCKRDLTELDKAALEWENAVECFDYATTNELIDVAIAQLTAAKRKYVYLMRAQSEIKVMSDA